MGCYDALFLGEAMRRRDRTRGKAVKTQRRKTLERRNAPKVARRRKLSAADATETIALLTRERDEALQQQTATADVLKVMSRSTFDLPKVLTTLVESAARLCEADTARIVRPTGKEASYYVAALYGSTTPEYDEHVRTLTFLPGRGSVVGRVLLEGNSVQIPDVLADPEYTLRETAKLAGYRTSLGVPLLREGSPIGILVLQRATVRPFTGKEIELAEMFAAQAVIAIENTRLLNELRHRTDDLSEALEQQTATSEVLKIISSSPGELQPVFDTLLAKATALCEASYGTLWLREADGYRFAALFGDLPQEYEEHRRNKTTIRVMPDNPLARIAVTRQPVQVTDMRTNPAYLAGDRLPVVGCDVGGIRTVVAVPMFKEGELIGAIAIYRKEVRPFTDKQVELVSNFGAQAVIAIENTRLLNELRESLQQQTATADVLKVISRSTFDLKLVLEALIESATRLSGAHRGHILQFNGEFLVFAAAYGAFPGFMEYLEAHPFRPGPGTIAGRAAAERRTVHVRDVLDQPGYELSALVKQQGYRTVLAVPMLREQTLLGVITILKTNVEPFTDKQIELVTTFADQAVIAIENARLLTELRESLQQQTATADVLKVISRSAFDLQVVLDTLVESAARLCEADSASIHRPVGGRYPYVASHGLTPEYDEYMRERPLLPGRGTVLGRAITELKPIQVNDVTTDPEYTLTEARKIGGFRTVLGVPLLREGVPIGIIMLTRNTVRPFTDKQIELVSTFADQAAIAIENVRLFESVEARTRELAASLEDLRNTQDRLVQTQKLASLGQLTAGIAHEIKNPLNFVNNFSGVSAELIDELHEALKDVSLNEKRRSEIIELMDTLRGNLDKVVQHGKRADTIVKNMLLHSREGSGEHRSVDINVLVEEGLNLAYHGARAERQGFNIKLEKSFDPNAGEADVFPQDITRVLLNLISNGFYAAIKRQGETNGGDYEPTLTAATKNRGDSVEIAIRDNGTGIPSDVKDKIFNPFFTTKPAGEGTGLGLSISHDVIVKQHGGSIEVDTQPGEFTEFRIILPRTAAAILSPGDRS